MDTPLNNARVLTYREILDWQSQAHRGSRKSSCSWRRRKMLTGTEPIVRWSEFTWWGFRGDKVKKLPRASPSKIEGDPKNRGEITEFEKEWLLEDGSDGIISTIEQIELNRVGLVSEISTRISEINKVIGSISSEASSRSSADSSLGGRTDGEIVNRGLAISGEGASRVAGDAAEATARTAAIAIEATARTAAIAAEASLRLAGDVAEAGARNAAIAVETVNRQAAITAETTARQLAIQAESTLRSAAIQVEATARDNAVKAEAVARAKDIAKIGFISTAEAEGILEVGTYPFCFGMGNQSDLNYGLPLPFSYTLQSIAYTSKATTTNHSIIFNIVHYPFNALEGPTI